MNSRTITMLWLPSLFFAKGMPRVVVFIISLLMFWQLRFSMLEMMLCVSLFYLPWALKVWWAPLIDRWLTHRQWILLSQLLQVFLFAWLAQGLENTTVVIIILLLIAWISALHNAAADRYARLHEQSFRHAVAGELSRKASLALGQGVLVMLVGNLQIFFRYDLLYSWRMMYYIVAGLFLLLFFWHSFVLKAPMRQRAKGSEGLPPLESHFSLSATPAFLLVFFLLCYPFAQQMIAKGSILFLVDLKNTGGLGLSPQEFALVMGTLGITGLTIGALWGRALIKEGVAAVGLQGIWTYRYPMMSAMLIPAIVYVLLSAFQPEDLLLVCLAVSFEQFAYGFGFALYLAFVKRLPYRERGKSLMALSMMFSCLLTGVLLTSYDYHTFFWMTLVLSLLSLGSVAALQCCSSKNSHHPNSAL